MYYLRTKAAAAAIHFTVDKTKLKEVSNNKENQNPVNGAGYVIRSPVKNGKEKNVAAMVCSLQNRDECLSCGS